VLIHYPHHPLAGKRVIVLREVYHADRLHFVIDSADGTRELLPQWMTEPGSANLRQVEVAVLPFAALRDLRATIDSAVLSFASCKTRESGNNVGASSESTAGPSHLVGKNRRAGEAATGDQSDGHRLSEATPDRVPVKRGRGGAVR
jgi:hypothetical protein